MWECAKGFLSQNCGTDVNECSTKPCQKGTQCIDIIKVNMSITHKEMVLKYISTLLNCLKSTNKILINVS